MYRTNLDKRNTTMEKVDFTKGILAIQPDLHRFAYKLTADRESANDLVQDCLLQALDNQEKFTYSKNLKGCPMAKVGTGINKV